ncbi:hypothetical protein [Planococcus plakortidis]|uniref:hypothetical protein n=1 Tax=Planococcus plakortidis TaxID=1038856 RepID=UPI00385CFBDC
MGLFNKGTGKEKLMEKQSKLGEQIRELQAKEMRIKNAMGHVETELEIDDSAGNRKRLDKLQGGLEKCQKDLEGANLEAQQVASELAQISAEQRTQEIASASQEYQESYFRNRKRLLMENELDKLKNRLWGKTNSVQPEALKRVVGLKYNEDLNPEHSSLFEAKQEAERKATEQADKEFNELMDKIKNFLEL